MVIDVRTADLKRSAQISKGDLIATLAVAGFGFMVDVYDSVLFAVVRVASLSDLGISGAAQLSTGVLLFNMQMSGMVLGGLLWGILGDKKGRRAALFGSIFLYSLANLINAFVHTIPAYAACRFFSGIGLAGEVGAAMTIAAEIMPPKYRTYGTAFVSVMGVLGSFLASTFGASLPWRMAFGSAAVGGFVLLLTRLSLKESPAFAKIKNEIGMKRGSIKLLLSDGRRVGKLVCCVLAMLPLFFVFGILISFAPEIWRDSPAAESATITVATLAMYYSFGETSGEVLSGILSHTLRSRKKIILLFLCAAWVLTAVMLYVPAYAYTLLCLPLGLFVGYWGVLLTSTAEQFGTNLRSTATTLVPNLMRATVIPMNFLFGILCKVFTGHVSAIVLGLSCLLIAFISVALMDETYGKDLDFIER